MLNQDKKLNEELLHDIIERNYFNKFKNHEKKLSFILNDSDINFHETCVYLSNNKINFFNSYNLKKILNYYIDNKFNCDITLVGTDSEVYIQDYLNCLNIIYKKFEKQSIKPLKIIIPSSGLFLLDQSNINAYNDLIKKFWKLNICLDIQINLYNLDIDKSSKILSNLNLLYSPTNLIKLTYYISKDTIKNDILNFYSILSYLNDDYKKSINIKIIEDRHIDSNLNEFLAFTNLYLDIFYNIVFQKNSNEFIKFLLNKKDNFISLNDHDLFLNNGKLKCNISDYLFINIDNLSIPFCPALDNQYYSIGKIHFNKNKFKINENNCSILIAKDYMQQSCLPNCESCMHLGLCNGFCMYNSFKDHGNLFVPIPELCILNKNKIIFILNYLKENNLIDYLFNNIDNNNFKNYLKILLQKGNGEQ